MAEVELNPQFGAELKDGFKPVNNWVSNTTTWLDEIQQFYRERSAIEKEYSSRLLSLAKKYFEKKTKKTSTLSVGETPTETPGSLESASMTTWGVQLTTLESRAADHDKFAVDLINQLAEPLKNLQTRCEDLRKQHSDQATKLEKERDGSYADLKKTKSKYDSVCQEHENRRKKAEGSRNQSAFLQHEADMNNAKNTYLISINVTNKQKERYYYQYVPDLLDSLQDLSESRTSKLNSIWARAAAIEQSTLTHSLEAVKHLASEIPRNNPVLDSMMFLRHNIPRWQEPPNFQFEPSPVWLDDDAMIATESAKTFLRNVLLRSKGQLGGLKRDYDSKLGDIEVMKRVRRNIREGKDRRDEVEAARANFTLQEELHEIEKRKIVVEVEIATIVTIVGDLSVGAKNHSFKPQTFKIPTNCDLCGERIWGLSAKGFDCRDCGFTCHSKCELKVPADCPGEQDKDEKRRLKVERQEDVHTKPPEPETTHSTHRSASSALTRADTTNSMNTLSSGYPSGTSRTESGMTVPSATDDAPPEAAQAPTPKPIAVPRRNRIVAPPPKQYVKSASDEAPTSNGAARRSTEKRAKMLYAYQQNGDGEISVDEGRDVAVIESDDGSGWIKVRAGAEEGLVPSAYAEILPQSGPIDHDRPESTYSASSASLAGSITGGGGKKKGPAVAPKRGAKKLKYVEAIYDYTARSDAEHSMVEGERFVLISKDSGDGWADVEKAGAVKSVPANYIQDA